MIKQPHNGENKHSGKSGDQGDGTFRNPVLVHFGPGNTAASIAVRKSGDGLAMRFNMADTPSDGPALPAGATAIQLRPAAGFDDLCVFSFSTHGKPFSPLGEAYTVVGGGWRGDLVGIYTFNNQTESGYIDVDCFDYQF